MFWGLFFLIIGALMILQHTFRVDLPVLKILFGCLLVYWGLSVIFGSFGLQIRGFKAEKIETDTDIIFSKGDFKFRDATGAASHQKFNSVFSTSFLDLSDMTPEEMQKPIAINNAFGKLIIKTRAGIPIKADINIGFGTIIIRGQKQGSLGEVNYQSENYQPGQPALLLEIDCGFGSVIVE